MITKVGRRWMVDDVPIPSYESYRIWGSSQIFQNLHGKIMPSKFTPQLVQEYLDRKKNKLPPFQDKNIVDVTRPLLKES